MPKSETWIRNYLNLVLPVEKMAFLFFLCFPDSCFAFTLRWTYGQSCVSREGAKSGVFEQAFSVESFREDTAESLASRDAINKKSRARCTPFEFGK